MPLNARASAAPSKAWRPSVVAANVARFNAFSSFADQLARSLVSQPVDGAQPKDAMVESSSSRTGAKSALTSRLTGVERIEPNTWTIAAGAIGGSLVVVVVLVVVVAATELPGSATSRASALVVDGSATGVAVEHAVTSTAPTSSAAQV